MYRLYSSIEIYWIEYIVICIGIYIYMICMYVYIYMYIYIHMFANTWSWEYHLFADTHVSRERFERMLKHPISQKCLRTHVHIMSHGTFESPCLKIGYPELDGWTINWGDVQNVLSNFPIYFNGHELRGSPMDNSNQMFSCLIPEPSHWGGTIFVIYDDLWKCSLKRHYSIYPLFVD